MNEQIGRNNPCPCGSGKKYKQCCFQKDAMKKKNPLLGRRITFSSPNKTQEEGHTTTPQKKPVDYAELMEHAFGESLHTHEQEPPIPENPDIYLKK